MRKLIASVFSLLAACGTGSTYVRSDQSSLGHIVIYRNGVAYFERYAEIPGDTLSLNVPADRVDDFLKSLTVVDVATGQPAPIAYSSDASTMKDGFVEMKIALHGARPHRLKLSYVTEAPSWKPSYRVSLAKNGQLGLQAWAVVDNTSGEDWNDVKLGVGSSSAMSFRFDLRTLRTVQREVLRPNDLFAVAPPIGGATFDNRADGRVLGDLSDEAIAMNDVDPAPPASTPPRRGGTKPQELKAAQPSMPDTGLSGALPQSSGALGQLGGALAQIGTSSNRSVVVEGYADEKDADKNAASLARANRVREQLLKRGYDPNRIVAVGKGQAPGRASGVRIIEAPQSAPPVAAAKQDALTLTTSADPIGTSHFESNASMTVPRGTSAMVAILDGTTDGEVVYLFDAESARGNATFPFRSLRIKNPTDSVLESGPVTVFGEGRFIGEGLSEPIPARSVAFVPFALDRQIVVEKKDTETDEIARVIAVQRGVFSTEVMHTRKRALTLHNRMAEKATVYVRHTVASGYKLARRAPPVEEKIGGASLFKVEIAPHSKSDLVIEEETPLYKTADIRTSVGMELVRVYLSAAATSGALKAKVAELIKLQQQIGNSEQRIATLREQMGEYKERMNELHAQLVTLRAVRTAGPLMQTLEKKMADVSDKLSKATVAVVSLQEELMMSRIHFQDGVADLTLESSGPVAQAND